MDSMVSLLRVGYLLQRRAREPATIGDEKDVPETDPYPPPVVVVTIHSPGAAISTNFPYDDHDVLLLFLSVAET